VSEAERWSRVRQIFDMVVVCPVEDRAALLRDLCRDDASLQAEVESVLAADAGQGSVFERSIDRGRRERVFEAVAGVLTDRTPALAAGARVGSYEIVALLGTGGMGEVYRARDTSLKRDVAIKVLPDVFAGDPERLARFEQEAELLAALNHPNVAQIHGIQEGALVMELVEGETLGDRIAKGPMPLDETLPIARQIAHALSAAHDQGIIHRDLKPSNIKVRSDGTAKVLDFGLAKAMESPADRSPRVPRTLAVTSPAMTRAGVILGTAAYMSPEQARGRSVDRRADIWAFGCVLYEMLTGRQAFDGESPVDTLGAVMHRDPDWEDLPRATPRSIRRLLRRCLEKDPARRLRDIGDVLHDVDEASDTSRTDEEPSDRRAWLTGWRLAATLGAVALLGAAVMWTQRPGESGSVRSLAMAWPDSALSNAAFELAPDGSRFVYVGRDYRLWVQDLRELQPRTLAGTDGAFSPFFSPDGSSVGFTVAQERAIKVVPVQGGSVRTVVTSSVIPVAGAWGSDGMVYFSRYAAGIARVASSGGAVEEVSRPGTGVAHEALDVLPNGRAALLTIRNETANTSEIGLLDFGTGQVRPLFAGARARFASSGHVIYTTADGRLHAAPFDQRRLQVTGPSVPLIENVRVELYSGQSAFTLSNNGTLLYQQKIRVEAEPVWVTRDGRATPLIGDRWTADFFSLSVSPDGRQAAASLTTGNRQDVWTRSLETGAMSRLTFENDGSLNYRAQWTDDGRSLTFLSNRSGAAAGELWRQRADGSLRAERLVTDGPIIDEGFISPDGQWAVYRTGGSGLRTRDIKAVRLGKDDHAPKLLVATPADEYSPALSADGRWLAYVSDESGRAEVYVRPFPDTDAAVWQVSRDGGLVPVWARSGRQLFHVNSRVELVAVTIRAGETFAWDPPRVLFSVNGYQTNPWHPLYDVSPDGERFLMSRHVGRAGGEVVLVLNWFQELKRKLAGR
jgi:serine/threonine protein kinase/Tol biopolymer transport system component